MAAVKSSRTVKLAAVAGSTISPSKPTPASSRWKISRKVLFCHAKLIVPSLGLLAFAAYHIFQPPPVLITGGKFGVLDKNREIIEGAPIHTADTVGASWNQNWTRNCPVRFVPNLSYGSDKTRLTHKFEDPSGRYVVSIDPPEGLGKFTNPPRAFTMPPVTGPDGEYWVTVYSLCWSDILLGRKYESPKLKFKIEARVPVPRPQQRK